MLNCSCIDVDMTSDFHHARDRKARKPHKCIECHAIIRVGEIYEYVSGKSEDGFFTVRTCLPCTFVRDSLMTCGHFYGELWISVHEANCGIEGNDDYYCICPNGEGS